MIHIELAFNRTDEFGELTIQGFDLFGTQSFLRSERVDGAGLSSNLVSTSANPTTWGFLPKPGLLVLAMSPKCTGSGSSDLWLASQNLYTRAAACRTYRNGSADAGFSRSAITLTRRSYQEKPQFPKRNIEQISAGRAHPPYQWFLAERRVAG